MILDTKTLLNMEKIAFTDGLDGWYNSDEVVAFWVIHKDTMRLRAEEAERVRKEKEKEEEKRRLEEEERRLRQMSRNSSKDKRSMDNRNDNTRRPWKQNDNRVQDNRNDNTPRPWKQQENRVQEKKPDADGWTETSRKKTKQNIPDNNRLLQKKSPNPVQKTRLCKFLLEKKPCIYRICHFAHSISELQPSECSFGGECRKQSCSFLHPTETVQSFVNRLGWNVVH